MKQCCLHSLDGKHLLLGWRKSADLEWSKILIQCCQIWRVRDVLHSGCAFCTCWRFYWLGCWLCRCFRFVSVKKTLLILHLLYKMLFMICPFMFFPFKLIETLILLLYHGRTWIQQLHLCVIPWHLSGRRLAQKNYLDLIHGSKTWVTGGLGVSAKGPW